MNLLSLSTNKLLQYDLAVQGMDVGTVPSGLKLLDQYAVAV